MRHDSLHSAELEAVRELHRSEHAPRELRQRLIERLAQPSKPALSRAGLERLPRSGPSRARQVWALVGAAALASCLWLLLGPIEQLAKRVQTRTTLGPEPAAPGPERVEPSGPESAPAQPEAARPCPLQEVPPGAFYDGRILRFGFDFRPGTSQRTVVLQTPSCGPMERYYVQLLSAKAVPKDPAPVLILIDDSGKNIDDLWVNETRWYFDELANDRRAIVILAIAAPGRRTHPTYADGGWQTDDGANPHVDDAAYLRRVVDDMAARGVIAGGNSVYLFGHGSGAALALQVAAAHPEHYSGVAAYKPSRLDLPLPQPTRGSRLARVLFIAEARDVWAPALNGIAARWAEALGVPTSGVPPASPVGASGLLRVDFGTPGLRAPSVRVLTLAARADLFPPPGGGEPLALAASRARPDYVNGAQEIWGYLEP